MCYAQVIDNMMDSRVLTVHPMGESATGRILEYVTLAATQKNLFGTDFHASPEGVTHGCAE
jgi:hypothetical protein